MSLLKSYGMLSVIVGLSITTFNVDVSEHNWNWDAKENILKFFSFKIFKLSIKLNILTPTETDIFRKLKPVIEQHWKALWFH